MYRAIVPNSSASSPNSSMTTLLLSFSSTSRQNSSPDNGIYGFNSLPATNSPSSALSASFVNVSLSTMSIERLRLSNLS